MRRCCLTVLFLLLFALQGIPAQAADSSLSIQADFGYDEFGSGFYFHTPGLKPSPSGEQLQRGEIIGLSSEEDGPYISL